MATIVNTGTGEAITKWNTPTDSIREVGFVDIDDIEDISDLIPALEVTNNATAQYAVIKRYYELLESSIVITIDGDAEVRGNAPTANFGTADGMAIGRPTGAGTPIRRAYSWILDVNELIPAGDVAAAWFVQQIGFAPGTPAFPSFALRKASAIAVPNELTITYANQPHNSSATGQMTKVPPQPVDQPSAFNGIPGPFYIFGGAGPNSLVTWIEEARVAAGDLEGLLMLEQLSTNESLLGAWFSVYSRESPYQVHLPGTWNASAPSPHLPFAPPYIVVLMD